MPRIVLLLVLLIIDVRIVSRITNAFREGMQHGSPGSPRATPQAVQMVRDPVCGTFVLPQRAVALVHGRTRVYFCSETCRDKYSARRESVEGRTA
jgi:YHS domain-containing protein